MHSLAKKSKVKYTKNIESKLTCFQVERAFRQSAVRSIKLPYLYVDRKEGHRMKTALGVNMDRY